MRLALAIRTFASAVRLGSISAAARASGISVAKASRLIRDLEQHLNTQLLNRSTNSLKPTEAGEILLHNACPLVDELESTLELIGTYDTEIRGLLRVHARMVFAHEFLVPALPRFLEQYPNLQIDLITSNNEDIDILKDNIDVDITFKKANSLDLVAIELVNKSDDVALVASPAYLLRKGQISHPTEIERHDCIVYGNDRAQASWAYIDAHGKTKLIKTNPRLITDNGFTMRSAAIENVGISILPKWVVERDIISNNLIEILPDVNIHYPGVHHNIFAVYQKSRRKSVKLKIFLQFLKNVFKETADVDRPENPNSSAQKQIEAGTLA